MSHNLKYMPNTSSKHSNVFLEEFYTGVDTKIYIDKKKVDFISSINFSVQENINPLYGYNSYVFDDIAIGTRLVVGSIAIPVKNYDELLVNFTKENHDILVKEYETLPSVPSWVEKERGIDGDNFSEDSDKRPNTRANISKPDEGHEDGSIDVDNIYRPPSKDENYRKPYFKKATKTFFNEYYTPEDFDINIYRAMLRENYKDINIYVGNMLHVTLKCVVYKGVSNQYTANDEVVYESLEFIARDAVYANRRLTKKE